MDNSNVNISRASPNSLKIPEKEDLHMTDIIIKSDKAEKTAKILREAWELNNQG